MTQILTNEELTKYVGAISENLTEKADRDLNNISEAAEQKFNNKNLIDYDNYTDITLSTSGSIIEITDNCLLSWAATFTNNQGFISAEVWKEGSLARKIHVNSGYNSYNAGFEMSLNAGDFITIYYQNISSNRVCRLYKYKGD